MKNNLFSWSSQRVFLLRIFFRSSMGFFKVSTEYFKKVVILMKTLRFFHWKMQYKLKPHVGRHFQQMFKKGIYSTIFPAVLRICSVSMFRPFLSVHLLGISNEIHRFLATSTPNEPSLRTIQSKLFKHAYKLTIPSLHLCNFHCTFVVILISSCCICICCCFFSTVLLPLLSLLLRLVHFFKLLCRVCVQII